MESGSSIANQFKELPLHFQSKQKIYISTTTASQPFYGIYGNLKRIKYESNLESYFIQSHNMQASRPDLAFSCSST